MGTVTEANKASAAQLQGSVPSPRELNNDSYTFELFKASSLSPAHRTAVWRIFEENMRSKYTASSFGWDPPQKKRELFHKDSRFILAHSSSGELAAFTMFRFDTEEGMNGDEDAVVYCYELQVSSRTRKLGLGAALMRDLESLARDWKMLKVMLTCFLTNVDAMAFYKRVGFSVDPISPSQQQNSEGDEDDEWEDEASSEAPADYEILSKTISV
ncbi:acyl-CoA N-acyltransferase [Auricularia subglabra TFB-10046 SS5]|nr:acyl-CoA N-acyltransferase [Auricularia subglabra TFB-10046 SS5]